MQGLIENVFNFEGLNLIIWCTYIGFMIASVIYYYQKKVIGGFVRLVLEKGANSPDTALTLSELGYLKHPAIRKELSTHGALRKIVWEVEDNYREGENGVLYCAREKALDLNLGKFYISEEKRIDAQLRYDNKGTDLFSLIIAAVIFFVIAVLACIWLPTLLSLIRIY